MNITEFLSGQNDQYLKDCFNELEDFREDGTLIDGEIRKLNKDFHNNNVTSLYQIGELVYREIAIRYFRDK